MTADRRQALRLLRSGLILAAASSSSGLLAQTSRRQKVALLVPLTGASATIGLSMQRAASLVQTAPADAVLVIDSGDSPATAAAAARTAVRQGAKLILGPLFGTQVRSVLAVAGRVPVIAFSNDESLLDSGAFLLGLTASQVTERILGYARGRGIRSVAVPVGDDAWSQQIGAAARRVGADVGLTISGVSAPIAALGSAAAFERAHGGRLPDAVLVGGGDAASLAMARALSQAGVQLLTTIAALSGPEAGSALAGAWAAAPDPAPYDGFVRGYETRHGGRPGLITALAYDAALVARDARAAGPITRDLLLALPQVAASTGKLRFRSDGSCVRPLAVIAVATEGYSVADAPPP